MSDGEVLIRAEHVSKKFCRSLKRSLWYGAQDVANSLMPWRRDELSDGTVGEDVFRKPSLRKDEFWAVRDVSFEVRRGECLGLIGHNGAGKSTLLKMLNSLIRPDAGRITMKGRVGALIELSAGFNPILTGRENIYNQAALLGFSKSETDAKFDAIVDFSELEKFLDMPVQNYSSGMRVRLGFAVAAQIEPDIVLLDEVLAVGDVEFRFKCLNRMAELLEKAAFIFVSHSMPQIHRVAEKVMLLDAGLAEYYGSDVGRGVDCYYSHMRMDIKRSLGNESVWLGNMELANLRSSESSSNVVAIRHGDDLRMRLRLGHRNINEKLAVQLVVWNQEMIPVLELVGASKQPFEFVPRETGETSLEAVFTSVPLNAGRYSVEVVIHTADLAKRLARFLPPLELHVESFTVSGANTVLQGSWAVL